MRKFTKIAAAVSSALLMSAALTARADITGSSPSAYAESQLNVSNFQITLGDGSSLIPLLGTTIQGLSANVQSQIAANFNGTAFATADSINPLLGGQSINISTSSGAGYIPFTSYTVGNLAAANFAGAASQHSGNALQLNGDGPTVANTKAQVNINNTSSIGNADSRQNLATTFNLILQNTLTFLVSFQADAYARIALGQPDVIAQVDRNWGIDVTDVTDPFGAVLLMSWEPDGTVGTGLTGACVGLGACTEVADAFTLNLQAALQNTGDIERTDPLGRFALLLTLPAGNYQIALNHDTSADAQAIPEPGSLALLGVALLGFAGMRKKSKKAA